MSDHAKQELPVSEIVRLRTRFEAAAVGLRLATSIARRFGLSARLATPALVHGAARADAPHAEDADLVRALRFARDFAAAHGLNPDDVAESEADVRDLRIARDRHLLHRLFAVNPDPAWGHLLVDLILLAA